MSYDFYKPETWITFAKDWNGGMSAKDMAKKYGVGVPTVRNWVAHLRKKGVQLEKRVRGGYPIDVKAINKALK